MNGADLWEDGFPHGTVEGYNLGCRGGACPGAIEYDMSCKRANTLAAGDYRYKKLAAAGASPAEISARLSELHDQALAAPRGAGKPLEEISAPAAPKPPEPAPPLAERSQDADPQEDAGEEPAIEREAPTDEPVEPIAEAEEMGHPEYLDTRPWTEGLGATAKARRIALIRDWCREQGYTVPDRGKIPTTALAAYAIVNPPGDPVKRDLAEEGRVLASERDDLIAAGADPTELEVPLNPDHSGLEVPDYLDLVVVTPDIAHRSDMLDETRARVDEPATVVLDRAVAALDQIGAATTQRAAQVIDAMKRPEWAAVAIAEDIERLRNLAARLEQELAHTEEERDQALAEAASAKRAMITAILRWDETNQINASLQLQLANLQHEREVDAAYVKAVHATRDDILQAKLRDAAYRRRWGHR